MMMSKVAMSWNIIIVIILSWEIRNLLASHDEKKSKKFLENSKKELRGPQLDNFEENVLQAVQEEEENQYYDYYGSSWYEGTIQDDDSLFGYYDSWGSGSYTYSYDDLLYNSGESFFYHDDDGLRLSTTSEKGDDKDDISIQKLTKLRSKIIPENGRVTQKIKAQVLEDTKSHLRGSQLQTLLSQTDFKMLERIEDHITDTIPSCCKIPFDECNVNGIVCPLVNDLNFDPVCGCDGVTYSNSCFAENFGCIRIWKTGSCPN